MRGTKLRLSVNNLLDRHSIVGMTAANAGVNPAASPNDVLTLLPARSQREFRPVGTAGLVPALVFGR